MYSTTGTNRVYSTSNTNRVYNTNDTNRVYSTINSYLQYNFTIRVSVQTNSTNRVYSSYVPMGFPMKAPCVYCPM